MKKIPILLLHGWNLDSGTFRHLKKELKSLGYQKLFSPDLPGFGKNQCQKPLNLSDYSQFVQIYLQRRKIKKIILFGHSFGGRVGIKLALERPDLFSALILSGTPGISPVSFPKKLFFLFLAKIGKIVFSLPPFSFGRIFAKKILYKTAQAMDFFNTKEEMRETFKNVVGEDLGCLLPKVSLPVLLLWGEKDSIVPLSVAKKMVRLFPCSELRVIPLEKHNLPWKAAKIVAQEIDNFLTQKLSF